MVPDRPSIYPRNDNLPVVLSFFSGVLGLDIGLENAGFQVRLACETNADCRHTITENKPDIGLIGDIRDYKVSEIRSFAGIGKGEDVDVVVGGPPCQAFSTAGRRKSFEDERGNVFIKFIDLAIRIKPKYLVIENVRGLLSAALTHKPLSQRGNRSHPLTLKGGALLHVLDKIKAAGYAISFNLYNAANFGTPQKRNRVIIICSRNGTRVPYLTPTHSESASYGLPKWRTFLDVVADLSGITHEFVDFPEKRCRYYRMLKPGQNWRNLPENLQQEALGGAYNSSGGRTGFLRRIAWDKPSPTLLTHPAMPATDLAHPEENRPLSIQEYKRLQEIPDHWYLHGSTLSKYRQIGNAVPSGLGKAIGRTIINHIEGNLSRENPGFRYSRYKNTDDITWEKKTLARLEKVNQKRELA